MIRRLPTFDDVLAAVAVEADVAPCAITARGRNPWTVRARQVVGYLARELLAWSYPEVARRLGRDHSTVVVGCRRVRERLATDPRIQAVVARSIARVERAITEEVQP